MIYSHALQPVDLTSTQWRLHVDPHPTYGTATVRLYQVPLPSRNPGGHLAYQVDTWEVDMPVRRLQSHDDLWSLLVEALMQKRLPGLD